MSIKNKSLHRLFYILITVIMLMGFNLHSSHEYNMYQIDETKDDLLRSSDYIEDSMTGEFVYNNLKFDILYLEKALEYDYKINMLFTIALFVIVNVMFFKFAKDQEK